MKLLTMIENLGINPINQTKQSLDTVVTGLALDSRMVEKGFLFAALEGDKLDGRDYIPAALNAGATSILLQTDSNIDDTVLSQAIVLEHGNPRKALAEMAARLYAPQPKYCVAITGTNGKTSVANFVKQIWSGLDINAASIGTLGVVSDKVNKSGGLTTPDTVAFHSTLQELGNVGVSHVVFEASSHGLNQHRMDGVEVAVAGFTNLSHEHLDYHGTMESYFEAKSRLFVELLVQNGVAVINTDNEWGNKLAHLCEANRKKIITIGDDEDNTIRLDECLEQPQGYKCCVTYEGQEYAFDLNLLGRFQVDNALMAAGMVLAEGLDAKKVFSALEHLNGVDGRMELAGLSPTGARVLIDYAHTPDGLENALASLQSHRVDGKLLIVFGCGGNRDQDKRPIMGKIAEQFADVVFVTDDNPRDEDPAQIRAEVLQGTPSASEFDDRAKAINHAISQLEKDDVLLITGKGHEQGQIVGDKVLPFSDLSTVRAAIESLVKVGVKS